MKTLIKNGRIATAGDCFYGDIAIKDGIVWEIGGSIRGSFDLEIDAKDKVVIPGGIDVHTHFNLHTGSAITRDDFYTGTVAAACGGTTSIVDHMGFGPEGCDLGHQLKVYHEYARNKAVIDYSFHGVIQHVNDDILNQLEPMITKEGISSFKLYMTYSYRIADKDIIRIMEKVKALGGILTVHAENHEIIEHLREQYLSQGCKEPLYHALSRPDYCEADAVNRLISLAAAAGDAPLYLVHLTTEKALRHVERAQLEGRRVYAETCPQYLLLDEQLYRQDVNEALKYILSPPLRTRSNCDALWQGIRNGSIQTVATDHCPFSIETDKQKGKEDFSKCPNGLPGVEERIPLMFSEGVMKGKISINKLVEVCCTNPARIFGLYPKKGAIMPGSDADITIIDPDKEAALSTDMLHGNADYTAYEGMSLKGYPIAVLSRGELIVEEGRFTGKKGRGQFIGRKNYWGRFYEGL